MTTKKRKRHTPEYIVRKLRDADAMLNAGKEPQSTPAVSAHAERVPGRSSVVIATDNTYNTECVNID